MGLVALQHVGSSGSGIEAMSPALAGRFSTTEPPGKPLSDFLMSEGTTCSPRVYGLHRFLNTSHGEVCTYFTCAKWPLPHLFLGFPYDSAGKESTCNAGDLGSISGLGRSAREGKGYPLQHSGLENSKGVIKSWTQLSDFNFHFTFFLVPVSLPHTPHIQLYLINIPGPLPAGSQTWDLFSSLLTRLPGEQTFSLLWTSVSQSLTCCASKPQNWPRYVPEVIHIHDVEIKCTFYGKTRKI